MTSQTDALLLGYQRRYVADTRRVVVVEKSRRVGLSWCDASDSVILSSTRGRNGADTLYISYNEDMAREYLSDCADWARQFDVAASDVQESVLDGEDDIKVYRIDFPSGYKILGMSSRPRNLRGKQGKVVIDEAAFHDDLDGLIKSAMAMLIWGGRVRVISTHNGANNPFNALVKSIRAGEKDYGLHRITFDDAVADGLYDRVRLMAGDADIPDVDRWVDDIRAAHGRHASEELDVIPSAGGDGIIKSAWLQRYSAPPEAFSRVIMSVDSAYKPQQRNDPSAITIWGEHQRGYYLLHAWAKQVAYPDLKRTVVNTADAWSADVVLVEDKASGQSLIQDLRADTALSVISIQPIGDKVARLEAVSHLFESGRVWLPEHAPWLPSYESELTDFPNAPHDDQVDSTSQALSWAHSRHERFEALAGAARDVRPDIEQHDVGGGWVVSAPNRGF